MVNIMWQVMPSTAVKNIISNNYAEIQRYASLHNSAYPSCHG